MSFFMMTAVTLSLPLVMCGLTGGEDGMMEAATYSSLGWLYIDNYTFLLMWMVFFSGFIALLAEKRFSIKGGMLPLDKLNVVLVLLSAMLVFMVDSPFWLYICYEFSLIPMSFIILSAGKYKGRGESVLVMMIYTLMFSLPFLYILFTTGMAFGSFQSLTDIAFLEESVISKGSMDKFPVWMKMLLLLVFAVKLPLFGLHFWLPLAHVEAPTFGSMILAGVLLKLGGMGIIRFSFLESLTATRWYALAYLTFAMIISVLVCLNQQDFKVLVAYSSVFHMTMLSGLLITGSCFSYYIAILVMFIHAICSPLMFFLVSEVYDLTGTRSLSMLRGISYMSPLLGLVGVVLFFYNLPAPPLPSFIAEVLSFSVYIFLIGTKFMLPILLTVFLALLFNLNWANMFLTPLSSEGNSGTEKTFTTSYLFTLSVGTSLIASLILLSIIHLFN